MLRTNVIQGEGLPDYPIWIIGEAPGEDEDYHGSPFIGRAGEWLNKGLRDAKVPRSQCYVDNVFNQRPPDNNADYFYQDKGKTLLTPEGMSHVERINRLIALHKPKLIIAMGGTAMRELAGKYYITKWRGSVVPCISVPEVMVYCCYHPSYVMRLMQESGNSFGSYAKKGMNVYPTFVMDLMRAWSLRSMDRPPRLLRQYKCCKSVSEIKQWFAQCSLESQVACDIETLVIEGELAPITRIGFANTAQRAMTIRFLDHGAVPWTLTQWAEILIEISKFFLSGRQFIFQNGLFDMTILGKTYGFRVANGCFLDTMVAHHCVFPYLPKGLDYIVSTCTWEPYYKDDRKKLKTGIITEESLDNYNCTDNAVTREAYPVIMRQVQQRGMLRGYNRTISAIPSLLYMMSKGVNFDVKRQKEIVDNLKAKLAGAAALFRVEAGSDVNYNSPKQMINLLYSEKGFIPITNTKTKKPTSDKNAINKLIKKYGKLPLLTSLQDVRKFGKLVSTYSAMTLSSGRIYTTYDPTGTVTWRLSSYESPLGTGGNLQNIPKRSAEGKEIRKLFIPDEGKILIAADLAQAEDRYVCAKSGDKDALERYKQGIDSHWRNAIFLFGLDADLRYDSSNSDHYRWRNLLAKPAKHAGNYGMGPFIFYEMLLQGGVDSISVSDCRELLDRQKLAAPAVVEWQAWVRDRIRSDGYLISANGRKRYFIGRPGEDTYKKAYAFEPQNFVGELLVSVIRDLHEEIGPAKGLEILMNVHDEVIVQVPTESWRSYIPQMRKIMETTTEVEDIHGVIRPLTIPVDFQVGHSWGELEEVQGI